MPTSGDGSALALQHSHQAPRKGRLADEVGLPGGRSDRELKVLQGHCRKAESLQILGAARVGKPGGDDQSGLEGHPVGAPPSKMADTCFYTVGVEQPEGDLGNIRRGDSVPVRIVVVRLLHPYPEPFRGAAQPTAGEVGLAGGEREKGALAVKIGTGPVANEAAVRDDVLDRDGIQELSRQIGVGPQQLKAAGVAGGQASGLDGQPGCLPLLSHAQCGFESELSPLLGDLPLFQVIALG
ncbi:hypothetical protein ACF07U_15160 [Streptomyces californicus]|uniref:hypothetical protein n=1 Tax=Streptomyces californicus TaxID=67351 RepID=UPI003700C445